MSRAVGARIRAALLRAVQFGAGYPVSKHTRMLYRSLHTLPTTGLNTTRKKK